MNFPYQTFRITNPPPYLAGTIHEAFPVVTVDVSPVGRSLQIVSVDALVDTGASVTVFPNHVAASLGFDLTRLPTGQFQSAGGTLHPAHFTDVTLLLSAGQEMFQWDTMVGFVGQQRWGLLARAG